MSDDLSNESILKEGEKPAWWREPEYGPPEQERRAHDHAGLRHEHYVVIDKPDHDHR